MVEQADQSAMKAIRRAAIPVVGAGNLGELIDCMAERRLVLIGEPTHGTREFYDLRAVITRILIEEKGFQAVALESDWPESHRVDRYVRGNGESPDAERALAGFGRFPSWIWRNQVVLHFVEWLRRFNAPLEERTKVRFHGLDVYGLYSSIQAILDFLDAVSPESAARARYRFSCLHHWGRNSEACASESPAAEDERTPEILAHLSQVRKEAVKRAQPDDTSSDDDPNFHLFRGAGFAKNAEKYYRELIQGKIASWSRRDRQMLETLQSLADHLSTGRRPARVVVWGHASNLGDAGATEMGQQGDLNLGQMLREKDAENCFLLGFSTYEGTVTVASGWGEPAETKRLQPALPGSYEWLFHNCGMERFIIPFWKYDAVTGELKQARLQRSLGPVYRPEAERLSHWFYARLSDQFDALIHIDRTTALEPLGALASPIR